MPHTTQASARVVISLVSWGQQKAERRHHSLPDRDVYLPRLPPPSVTRPGLDEGEGEVPVPLSDCSFSLNTREMRVIIP